MSFLNSILESEPARASVLFWQALYKTDVGDGLSQCKNSFSVKIAFSLEESPERCLAALSKAGTRERPVSLFYMSVVVHTRQPSTTREFAAFCCQLLHVQKPIATQAHEK